MLLCMCVCSVCVDDDVKVALLSLTQAKKRNQHLLNTPNTERKNIRLTQIQISIFAQMIDISTRKQKTRVNK